MTNSITLSRRNLLHLSVVGGIATALSAPGLACAEALPYMNRIGLQLYTLRNQMAQDPKGTLKLVAQAGYRQVELMSIDKQAVEIAAIARDNNLMVHSAFMDWKAIVTPEAKDTVSVEQTIDLAEKIGLRHIVFGYIAKGQRETMEQCQRIAEATNAAAEKAQQAGLSLCYHNHSFEFAKLTNSQQTGFDLFVERFDPKLVTFELDVFWVKIGGYDPMELMRKLSGRISQVHLKDLKTGTGVITDEGQVPHEAFKELGAGSIDISAVMKLAKEIGVLQCHVEQDQSPAPLESIVKSLEHLNRLA